MSGFGRGRGEAKPKGDSPPRKKPVTSASGEQPSPGAGDSSDSRESGERAIRGRAGYRQHELTTIPKEVTNIHSVCAPGVKIDEAWFYANFVQLQPMEKQQVYKYRIDFEPDVESMTFRSRLYKKAAREVFGDENKTQFDGYSEARTSLETKKEESVVSVRHPENESEVKVKIKRVGFVLWGSFEMLRLYNLHMKEFLKFMNFYRVGQSGAYVNNDTEKPVGSSDQLTIVRGFITSANIHEEGKILMNLEPCHKMVQRQNLLQYMAHLREVAARDRMSTQDAIRSALIGKLVITGYNKYVYKIEDIDFDSTPTDKFKRKGEDIAYTEYFKTVHNITIRDTRQPLLIAIDNNRRRDQLQSAQGDEDKNPRLIPELCNIAGLTERQRTDNRLKMDMIRSCQVPPKDRLDHLLDFVKKLNDDTQVKEKLASWGYKYAETPVRVKGRVLPLQPIGIGRNESKAAAEWPKVNFEGSFENSVIREKINVAPDLPNCHVLISRASAQSETIIMNKLQTGLSKVGMNTRNLIPVRIKEGDAANLFVQYLRQLPADCKAVIIVLPNQDKEKYDAVKKYCSIERGLTSQVVTTRLMTDERKSGGAATKIGIQIAAKLGGEPWRLNIPMSNTMICGYDTYHDTLQRGRSFGAFVASTNSRFSKFWSKADKHDKLDELSTQLANNVGNAMEAFKRLHETKSYPNRIIIYRDGVSDGQIEHVFKIELESVKQKIKQLNANCRLSFVIVNKRIGARFYMKQGDNFVNPTPGCVIDTTVTRKERFDFYLVSQHTRQGTVTPTYYNIIHENSGLTADRHQILAYTMCYLYYNWTGGVRVPAVCQYAHKLAYLCGEHLHASPNANLDDRLHFL